MKKFFLVALTAFMAVTSQAQIVSSRSSSVTREPSNITWYYRAGLAIDGITGSGEDETTTKIGYETGVGFMSSISSLNGGWWGAEAGLATRGFELDDTWTAHGIYIQPSFGWNFDVANNIAITPHAGLFASYDLFGSPKHWDEGLQKFDMGFNIGVGVWINKKVNIDFKFRKGLINMLDTDDYYYDDLSATSNKFVISTAIAF